MSRSGSGDIRNLAGAGVHKGDRHWGWWHNVEDPAPTGDQVKTDASDEMRLPQLLRLDQIIVEGM